MLRIAQIGSLWENIPPEKYGGTERIIWSLTEGLQKKGHKVTLFACGTAKTSAKLVSVYPRPLTEDGIDWNNLTYPLLNITACFDRQQEFDIIHMHLNKVSDFTSLPLFKTIKNKVIFTLHFPYPAIREKYDRHLVLQKYKDLNYVSISNNARKGGENLNWIATVYNGIEESDFTFWENSDNYYLWVGKFNHDKGPDKAIAVAKKTGIKLILAGKIDRLEKEDYAYFKQRIEPRIDQKQITYIGEIGGKKKNEIFGKAKAFLNPINWNEPFGLVMAESLAVGTPVISYRNGAAEEIIVNGETGFLVDSLEEMVQKIPKVDLIDRKKCRQRFEEHFTAKIMVENYEKLYKSILDPTTLSELRGASKPE